MPSPSPRLLPRSSTVLLLVAAGCATSDPAVEHVASVAEAMTGADIANVALANLGKGACDTNSAGGKDFDSSCTGNGGAPEYWCADFARWVWATAGASNTSELTAAAGSFYVYGQNHGTLHSTPSLGDAVVYNYHGGGSADHVALVTKLNSDGSIETVSGDWNGMSGSEAYFSSTSHVVLNTPAYPGVQGSSPGVMGMTISGFISAVGVTDTTPYAAKFVAQSFPLASTSFQMFAGQTLPATIELKNVGSKGWDANTRLGTTQPRDASSPFEATSWVTKNRPAAVSGAVAPGASFTFKFDLHAPAKVGSYKQYFGVLQEGVAWFSDPGQGGPADDQLEAFIEVVAGVRGYLDTSSCSGITGWAQDQATPDAPIDVELTFDGVLGAAGVTSVKASANASRPDLCKAIGSCDHGFSVPIPAALRDGRAHQVHAYGLAAAGPNAELTTSPGTFSCTEAAVDAGGADAGANGGADAGVGAVDAAEGDSATSSKPASAPASGGGCSTTKSARREGGASALMLAMVLASSAWRRRAKA